jgi:hypothetical protein
MNEKIREDLTEMKRRLSLYVDKGRLTGSLEAKEEPVIAVKPDISKIKPLSKVSSHDGQFLAVDCSTRTLKRANNWGIYLMRSSYAIVKGCDVEWGYKERICTAVGDAYSRSNFLKDIRIELESQMALEILNDKMLPPYYDHTNSRSKYLLLDGGGYFGGDRKFRVWLYEKCEKEGINLFGISKNSPSLHDDTGRDFIAAACHLSSYSLWVYHPVREADKDKSLYGDISIVKLCQDSSRVFRCDIMQYLTRQEISEVVSPLTAVAEDPRCLGYPIALWLAHEFSGPSDSMLLSYHDQIEETFAEVGLLETLRREESSCSFADELHGIRHAFEWEWWSDQF